MSGEERQRIDKWLVYARVVKSRSLAAALVGAGHVRVNRDKITDPARTVKPGDVLTIALDRRVLVWRVLALAGRRAPPRGGAHALRGHRRGRRRRVSPAAGHGCPA